MPMAVYYLMFKDPGLSKLLSSHMEIEMYTNDVVKVIGTCYFYLVHPESKQLKIVNGKLTCRDLLDLLPDFLFVLCWQRKWKHSTVL